MNRLLLVAFLAFPSSLWAMGGEGLVGPILWSASFHLVLLVGGLWAMLSLLNRSCGALIGASVIGGLLGLTWFYLVDVCPPIRKTACFRPNGDFVYFLVFFKWLFITALVCRILLATGAVHAPVQIGRLRVRSYGIYNREGQLLSAAEVSAAIGSSNREACNALLQSLGRAESRTGESLEALRIRCVQAVTEFNTGTKL